MSRLSYRYQLFTTSRPVITLGGRYSRPKPVIPVISVLGPGATRATDALLDTGADDTVFHESVATYVGIDLSSAPRGAASGVGLGSVPVPYAAVVLRMIQGRTGYAWR